MSAVVLVVLLCASTSVLFGQENAPKRVPDARASECAACHGTKLPLPADHAPTAALTWQDCKGCHVQEGKYTLTGKLPLMHAHLLSGVGCDKCHVDVSKPEPATAKTCSGCHEPEKVALVTAELSPTNPHNSPHYGQDSDCNMCHHQHSKSVNACEVCHGEYSFTVP